MRALRVPVAMALTLAAVACMLACGGLSTAPSKVPVFTQLAFVSDRTVSPPTGLFLMTLNGSGVTPVPFSNMSVYAPSVSADLKTFAFEASGNVWVSNADGSTQTQLTSNGNSYAVKVSPDGTKIVFNQMDSVSHIYNLWVMKVDGTGQFNLTSTMPTGMTNCYGGSFSADSTRIAMNCQGNTSSGVFTINPDGTGLATVTTQTYYIDTPVFTPDATKILFVLYGQAGPLQTAIFSVNLDGSDQTSVATAGFEAEILNSALFYTVYDSTLDRDRIYTSNLDGSNAVALTDGTSNDYLGTATD